MSLCLSLFSPSKLNKEKSVFKKLLRKRWSYVKKLKMDLPFDPVIPLLGTKNTNTKEHKHPYVHCSIIYNHPDMEAAQVSISK